MSAFISLSNESSPHRSISDCLGHLRPLISRGAGSPPPAFFPTPSPSPPPAPLRPSQSSPAIVMNSPNAPCSPGRIKVTSDSISQPTAASFASLVRFSIPAAENVPLQPPQHQPQPLPRTASLGMLKSVVTRAVRRREMATNEAKGASEGKPVEEGPGSSDVNKKPNVPQRTSSTDAVTHESDAMKKIDTRRGSGQGIYSQKSRSRRSSARLWEAV